MKKLLLGVSLIIAGGASAQIYSEDFEGTSGVALPGSWTQVTAATDGGFQTTTDYNSTYFTFAAHTRYVGTNDDICNCDKANEELISDAIAIPAAGTHVLSFEYVLGQYYGETADIAISTDGGATYTVEQTLANTQDAAAAHNWMSASVNLSGYAGQSINLVWVYHDNADWGSGLMVDDVEINALAAVDMEMTAVTMNATAAVGMVDITGTVTNNGADNITSIDITWNDGTGPNSQTFPVNLNFGDSYNFTHGTQLNATAAGSPYALDVCVVASGDADASNDCITHNLGVVSTLVDKYVLIEEKTGTWCQYCPYGSAAMENVSALEPFMIGVAIHNADPMAVASYDSGSSSFPDFGGYPYAASDRALGAHAADIQTSFDARENEVPPASISFTTAEELTAGVITVTPSVDMITTLTGNYRLGVILVEDQVTGTGSDWLQVNALSGGSSVPQGAEDWALLPNPTDVVAVFGGYDHVGRALGDDEISGAAGSLPGTLTDGTGYEHTYTFTVAAEWDLANMHAVAILVDMSNGFVLNAGETPIIPLGGGGGAGLNEDGFNFETTLAPNPTTGLTNVTLTVNEASKVTLTVVDMLGNVVATNGEKSLIAGTHGINLDLTAQPAGMYFANINVNGVVKTIKVNVVK